VVLFLKPAREFNLENPTRLQRGGLPRSDDHCEVALRAGGIARPVRHLGRYPAGHSIGVAARGNTFGKGLTAVLVCWGVWIVLKLGWVSIFG